MEEESDNLGLPFGWVKKESASNPGCSYYWYGPMQYAQWQRPTATSNSDATIKKVAGKKRARALEGTSEANGGHGPAKIGVIVPFRDLDKEQHRQQHLNMFIPSLKKLLKSTGHPFSIYIIEQSDDSRKINSGK